MDYTDAAKQAAMRAVLAMEEVRHVTAAFDQGEINVFAALAALARVCEPYQGMDGGWREAG
mgnify:CR=1 FL=1